MNKGRDCSISPADTTDLITPKAVETRYNANLNIQIWHTKSTYRIRKITTINMKTSPKPPKNHKDLNLVMEVKYSSLVE